MDQAQQSLNSDVELLDDVLGDGIGNDGGCTATAGGRVRVRAVEVHGADPRRDSALECGCHQEPKDAVIEGHGGLLEQGVGKEVQATNRHVIFSGRRRHGPSTSCSAGLDTEDVQCVDDCILFVGFHHIAEWRVDGSG